MYLSRLTVLPRLIIAASAMLPCMTVSAATPQQDAVKSALNSYLPGTSQLGPLRVGNVNVDASAKKIVAELNETAAYIPLTQNTLAQLKKDVATASDSAPRQAGKRDFSLISRRNGAFCS